MKNKICSICGCKYEGYGHNADPVTIGRCCDECNSIVIKMRILLSECTECIDEVVMDISNSKNDDIRRYGLVLETTISTPNNIYPMTINTFYTNGVFRMYCFSEYPYTTQFQDTLNNYLDYKYNKTSNEVI